MKAKLWIGSLLLLVLGGCEMGWDVAGHVNTRNLPARDRPLYVFVGESDDTATDPATWALHLAHAEKSIPAQGADFRYSELGCPEHQVAVIVWAPAMVPATPPDSYNYHLEPGPGDYVARSRVLHPYCGWRSKAERVELTLRP